MRDDQFDIAIVGGGIHGTGVAQAAAAAGYKVALLEKSSLAAGTSSRSSKLIHGGLRYLESGQFKLVRESLRERDLLLKLAPKLVRAVPFYIPIYRNTRRGTLLVRLGLIMYSLLGGLKALNRFRTIPKKNWHQLEGLVTRDLRSVFCYWDAQTNDRELTEAVMRSAQVLGARLFCPADVTRIDRNDTGYQVFFSRAEETGSLACKMLINAAGPWANRLLERVSPPASKLEMELVQGSHIVIEGSMHDKVFYLEAPSDGRTVFVMPWENNNTLVGTTEHRYEGDPADVKPLQEEIDYLVETLRHYFPGHGDTILDSFAGLRVLPETGHSHFHRPRETIFHTDPAHPNLLTIYGGKLTGYRNTANKVLQDIQSKLGTRKRKMFTNEIYLTRVD